MDKQKKWSDYTPAEKKKAKWIIGVFMFIIAFPLVVSITFSEPKEPVVHNIVENSPWDSSVKQVEDYLEMNLNDPDSYKSVQWGEVLKNPANNGYIVRHAYRARNLMGGIMLYKHIFYLDSLGVVYDVCEYD